MVDIRFREAFSWPAFPSLLDPEWPGGSGRGSFVIAGASIPDRYAHVSQELSDDRSEKDVTSEFPYRKRLISLIIG